MSKARIVSIDFDGTLVDHEFPKIGALKPFALEVLTEMINRGYKLVLNTCREDTNSNSGGIYEDRKYLTEAVEFMRSHGIEFRSVNENHPDDDFRSGDIRRKVFAHVYIDDRNLGGFPGWDAVGFLMFKMQIGRFAAKEAQSKGE